MYIRLVFLISIFLLSIGCIHSIKKSMTGSWNVNVMKYKKYNLTGEIDLNEIETEDGIKWLVPIILKLNENHDAIKAQASYFMNNKKQFIYFKTINQYFNDTFEIKLILKDTIVFMNKEKYLKISRVPTLIRVNEKY